MLKVDYYFNYKNLLRFILLHVKGDHKNSYSLPFIKRLVLYFDLYGLIELDQERVFNYFFLFRFFFGKKAFISNKKVVFLLGVTYNSFKIQAIFKGREIYFPLFFLSNDLLAFSTRFSWKWESFLKQKLSLSFSETSLFLEKKTNVGLYNLQDRLNFMFFFEGGDITSATLLLDCFKIINIKEDYFF